MTDADSPWIASSTEYERAVQELQRQFAAQPDSMALATAIARVVRFEIEHAIPPAECLLAKLQGNPSGPTYRRTALISDIHGHHEGLLAVMKDIERQSCDRIVCLGDIVEGGTGNEEVVATLRSLGIPVVRGNHDENNDADLSADTRQYLDSLPEHIVEGDILFVHISPRGIKRKIDHAVEAWNVFDETTHRLMFIGHVHVPLIFGKRSTSYGEAMRHEFAYNVPFSLADDDRYIVSVGSIGYGRDRVGKLRYAIHDASARTVELRAIDGPLLPFDYSLR